MKNTSFYEEMKKISGEIEIEENRQFNYQVSITSAISFIFTIVAIAEMIVSNNDIKNTAVGIFAGITSAISFYRSVKRVDVSVELLMSDLIQLLCVRIDEEGQGYLSDFKSEWINLELSQEQIKIKELMFIADHYWGRLIAWMRLPRFSTSTRIR